MNWMLILYGAVTTSTYLLIGFDALLFVFALKRCRSITSRATVLILLFACIGLVWDTPRGWLVRTIACVLPVAALLYCRAQRSKDQFWIFVLSSFSVLSGVMWVLCSFYALNAQEWRSAYHAAIAAKQYPFFDCLLFPVLLVIAVFHIAYQRQRKGPKTIIVDCTYLYGSLLWMLYWDESMISQCPGVNLLTFFSWTPTLLAGPLLILLVLHLSPATREVMDSQRDERFKKLTGYWPDLYIDDEKRQ